MRRLESEVQKLDQHIGETIERRDALKIKFDAYAELLRELRPAAENGKPDRAPKMTELIMEYVRANPGTRAVEVVDQVLGLINTTAKNPRKNAHQTILNLKNRGWLEPDGEGGLRLGSTNGHGARTP